MRRSLLLNIILFLFAIAINAQSVKLVYNPDYATVQFVKKLLDPGPSVEKEKYFLLKGLDLTSLHFLDSLRMEYLNYSFRYYDYPVGQKMPLAFFRLMEKYILDEIPQKSFRQYAEGIIPEEYIRQYERLLYLFKPIYLEIVEKPYITQINLSMQLMNSMMTSLHVEDLLQKIAVFYGVKMKDYTVAIYPVLDNVLTSGTSFLNRAEVALPIIQTDVRQAVSTLIHEISHLFYSDMSNRLKRAIEVMVVKSPLQTARYSNWLMDEVLATAVGNGWAYRQLFNKEETGSWYYRSNYVSEASKIVSSLISHYIVSGRSIDMEFVKTYTERLDRQVRKWMKEWDFLLLYREVRGPAFEFLTLTDQYFPFFYYRRYLIDNKLEDMSFSATKIFIFSENYEEEWSDISKYLGTEADSIPDFSKPFIREKQWADKSVIILINGNKEYVESVLKEKAIWYQFQQRKRNARKR